MVRSRAGYLVVVVVAAFAVVATISTVRRGEQHEGLRVSRDAENAKQWPLTAAAGWLECSNDDYVIFTVDDEASPVNGKTFAISPQAREVAYWRGWIDVAVIRASPANPSFPGEHVYLGGLIELGLGLCE